MTISPVTQLVAAIQSQLAARTAPGAARKGAPRNRARGSGYDREGLAGLIELRVAQIAPDDTQRGRKAFRVFLEAVLLSHFGAGLANDPRFYHMLDDIQGTLEADPACAALVADAVAHLLARQG